MNDLDQKTWHRHVSTSSLHQGGRQHMIIALLLLAISFFFPFIYLFFLLSFVLLPLIVSAVISCINSDILSVLTFPAFYCCSSNFFFPVLKIWEKFQRNLTTAAADSVILLLMMIRNLALLLLQCCSYADEKFLKFASLPIFCVACDTNGLD